MMIRAALALALLLAVGPAVAQTGPGINPVTPQFGGGSSVGWVPVSIANPLPVSPITSASSGVTTTMAGGSIATQNIFQSILPASTTRKGCTVQNTSASDVLYLFFGAIGSANLTNSFQLQPSQSIYCTTGNGQPLTDNVSATCTDATTANCTLVVSNQ